MTAVSAGLLPALAVAAPWELNQMVQLPDMGYVSQKVELVDINNDGFVDIVLANSSGTDTGNEQNAQPNQLLINDQGLMFTEIGGVFEDPDNAYAIKAGDLDNDGDADLVVGVNYIGTSYVLMNDAGTFTRLDLPGPERSIGDLELGDVDLDGDLDIFASDWGMSQPYGDPVDEGGPLVLWLGDGQGGFTDGNGNLPMGVKASYVFDLELVDMDNDFDLDVMVSTRGVGNAVVLKNDGTGTFTDHPVAALQPMNLSKQVNVAFTPIDLNGDSTIDVLTLQDGAGGGGQCVMIEGKTVCAKRNSLLVGDGMGGFADNPGAYWDIGVNPPKLDFDAATLDFDNNGTPDVVTTGLRLAGMDINSRLLLNNGTKLVAPKPPSDAAFPVVAQLGQTFGLMFADFNRDSREDVALASRDAGLPSFVLFGRTDPVEGVPVDVTAPKLAPFEKLPDLLYFGKDASGRTRANDYKTPTAWHDYQFDDAIGTYNLTGDGDIAAVHMRRIPYMEFALSLANPDDIKNMPDNDPNKFISPSLWYGEALWRVKFTVPYNNKKEDTLTWQWCAIDAAGNKGCIGPFVVELKVDPEDCGNGMVEPWETCDDPNDPNCVMCDNTCGNGICDPNENNMTCPQDCPCDNDGACEPPEDAQNCPNDCDYDGVCGDMVCNHPNENPMNCPDDCPCDFDMICEPPEAFPWCSDCDDGGGTVTDSGVTDTGGECNNNGICELGEDASCPDCANCNNDGICQPDEMNCPNDCTCNNDGVCDPNENQYSCPNDCPGDTASESDTDCDSAGGAPGQCELDDDGCGCVTEPTDTRGLWASLLIFGAFGVRRFRKRA